MIGSTSDPTTSSGGLWVFALLFQQPRCVVSQDAGAVLLGDLQRADACQHRRQAADLVRIITAGQDVIGAGEGNGQLESAEVEIYCVVVELFEIVTRGPRDLRPALGEGVE